MAARVNVTLSIVFVAGAVAVLVCLALLMRPFGGDGAVDLDRDGGTAAVAGVRAGVPSAGESDGKTAPGTPGGEREKVARGGERVMVSGEARCEGVRGRVLDQGGRPLSGARVLAARVWTLHDDLHPRDYRVFETTSAGDGWYALEKLPAGMYSLAAVAPGRSGTVGQRLVAGRSEHFGGAADDCDIVVYPSGEIAGCVKDRDGAPVAGAWVAPYDAPALLARTDAGGAFTLRDLPTGSYHLYISAAGYCPIGADVYTGTGGLAVVLDRGGTATGVVRYQDKPVAGIGVIASGRFPECAVTDGEGRFTIGGLDPGRCDLRIAADGFCAPARSVNVPAGGGSAKEVVFDLEQTGGIAGVLIARSSGEPIPGAWIEVLTRGAASCAIDRRRTLARTGDDGRFEFSSLPAGEYMLAARNAGDHACSFWRDGRIIAVAPGAVSGGIEFKLEQTPPAAILVRGPSGEKISGAGVTTWPARFGQLRIKALEAEEGVYILRGLEPGAYRVTAGRRGWGTRTEVLAFGENSPAPPLEIVLKPGVAVTGKVVDQGGEGVAFAEVLVDEMRAVTEADGSFVVSGMAAKECRALARAAGYRALEIPVEVKPGMKPLELKLLLAGEHYFGGVVKDDAGDPVAGIEVEVWQTSADGWSEKSALSDPAGRVRVEGLAGGAAYVSVLSDAGIFEDEDREFPVDRDDYELAIKRYARISGTVRDATGSPVPLFFARAGSASTVEREDVDRFRPRSFSPERARDDLEEQCCAAGAFELERAAPGEVFVVVRTPEGAVALSERLVVEPGGAVSGVAIVLPEVGTVAGRVYDAATMEPVRDAMITIQSKGQEQHSHAYWSRLPENPAATTGDDGTFRAAGIPGGALVVQAVHPEYEDSDEYDIAVRPRIITGGLEIALRRGQVVKGCVRVDGEGKPGARVSLRGGWLHKDATAGHGGFYEIRGLPPATYSIDMSIATSDDPERYRYPDYLRVSRRLPVQAGSEAVCDFDLVSGCAIAGKTYVCGKPEGGVHINFERKSGQGNSVWTSLLGECNSADDGSFRIDYLVPGNYRIDASAEQGFSGDFSTRTKVQVVSGVTALDLYLAEGTGEISGVVFCDGRPFPAAIVELGGDGVSLNAEADENGSYRFEGLPNGEFSLYCYLQSSWWRRQPYLTASVTLESGRSVRQDFQFVSGAGIISGRITNNGAPVRSSVSVERIGGGEGGRQSRSVYPGESGEFRIDNLAPGLYELFTFEPRHMRQLVEVTDYKEARADFAMRSGDAHIAGRVRLPEGAGDGAARIFIFAAGACGWTEGAAFMEPTLDGGLIAETAVDAPEGVFGFRDLEPQEAEAVAVIIRDGKIAKIARLAVSIAAGGPEIELSLAE